MASSPGSSASAIPDRLSDAVGRIQEYINANVGSIPRQWTTLLPGIENIVEPELDKLTSGLDGDHSDQLVERIANRREKLPLESGTVSLITGICQQVLAFGAAGLALALGFADKLENLSLHIQQLLLTLGVLYASLILVSLVVLVLYVMQARFRYPFISLLAYWKYVALVLLCLCFKINQ